MRNNLKIDSGAGHVLKATIAQIHQICETSRGFRVAEIEFRKSHAGIAHRVFTCLLRKCSSRVISRMRPSTTHAPLHCSEAGFPAGESWRLRYKTPAPGRAEAPWLTTSAIRSRKCKVSPAWPQRTETFAAVDLIVAALST
jgi:hypothetical protein